MYKQVLTAKYYNAQGNAACNSNILIRLCEREKTRHMYSDLEGMF